MSVIGTFLLNPTLTEGLYFWELDPDFADFLILLIF